MSKQGVSRITGNPHPKVGEQTSYTIEEWYPATPQTKKNPAMVTWELFKRRSNGTYTTTNIKKVGSGDFTFGEVASKHTYRLEAYLHSSEGQGPSTIDINPVPAGVPKINKVELLYSDDSVGTVFSYHEKLIAKAQCVNLRGEKLLFTLWEDSAAGNGHNTGNLFVDSKQAVVESNGTATAEFILTKALMQKAVNGEREPQKLEFYVTVEYYENRKHATNNIDVQNPEYREPARPGTAEPAQHPAPSPDNNPPVQPEESATEKPASKKEENGIGDPAAEKPVDYQEAKGTVEPEQTPTQQAPEGKSTSVVEELKTESLLDAYFAKEEFTVQTEEPDGQHTYTFQGNNNNINKDSVANIIKTKVDASVKKDKKYAKLETIKAALTKTSYAKGESVSFALHKLGPAYVRINNAPLEDEVYIVATTMLLDGKEVNINIREKEPILVEKDANLPVLEAKENGNELTTLKATAQNGIAKVKIKLRPKSDDTLKAWQDKLSGIKDGTHTYTFGGNGNNTGTEAQKKRIAGIILNKIKAELTEQKKFAKVETIEAALTKQVYNKDEQVTFDVYKSVTEFLWLKADCQGNLKKHEGEFLKKEGAYFEIGKKCPRCKEKITLEQIESLFGVLPNHKAFRQEIVDNLNKYIFDSGKDIHIDTCLRKAHFFAQVGAETSGINPDWMVETDAVPYGASNITASLFGERATKLSSQGKINEYCAERPQKKLLSFLYAAENGFGNGNGNEASGDGYTFRGRGLKQLTGRGNYKQASTYLKEIFPDEYIDLEANPDKVKEAKYAVLSAIAYWESVEVWKTADTIKVSTDDNIKKIRRTVNGGTAGWKKAKEYFEKGIDVFKVNSCSPVESDSTWHDPIDNPQRTYYNSSGAHKEQNGAFGPVRTKIENGVAVPKNHQGLDIFADVDTPCKACLDGTIVSYSNEGANGYGNVLVLEVSGEDLRNAKRAYTHEFTAEVESGTGFDINAEKFYLRYAHLKSAEKTSGTVTAGELIAHSGDSGNASGVPNPHLHFEVAMKATGNGTGLQNRYNPAYFVRLTAIDQPAQETVKNARS